MWFATKDFKDWDGVEIKANQSLGEMKIMGRDDKGRQFYNFIKDGAVTCVYVGIPHHIKKGGLAAPYFLSNTNSISNNLAMFSVNRYGLHCLPCDIAGSCSMCVLGRQSSVTFPAYAANFFAAVVVNVSGV